MTNNERWICFISELRAYVEEHHHFPNKHTSMLNAIQYTRKKIREGTLEEWKVEQFREIEGMRELWNSGFREMRKLWIPGHFNNKQAIGAKLVIGLVACCKSKNEVYLNQ